mgnify:CR=1 FL=1
MYVLVSYQAGALKVDQHPEYLQAKEQMDAEYNTVLGNELEDVKPSAHNSSDFDAEITFEESGHWVWHIEELD